MILSLFIVIIFTGLIVARARSFGIPVFWPLAAFFLPLLIATADLRFGMLPVYPDAQFYHQLAWDTSRAWQRGEFLPSTYHNQRTQVYASIVAVLYTFTGRAPFSAIILNTAFWGLSVCYWLQLSKEAFGIRSEVFATLLLAYPAALIYAASFLREAVTSLVLVLTMLHLFRWFQMKRLSSLINGGAAFSVLILLRPESLPVVLVAIIFTLCLDIFGSMGKIKKYATLILISCSTVSLYLLMDVSGYYNPFRVDFLETKRQNLSQSSFSYLETLSYDSWFDVLLYLPIRLFYFLFQPFPWLPSNYHLTFATIDALFMLIVIPLAVVAIVRYKSKLSSEHILLLAFAALSLIGYALVVSTKGAVSRRRLISMPILILFASLILPRVQFLGPWSGEK